MYCSPQAWLHPQASGPMRARRHGAAINRMVKGDQQIDAANASASISFNHAKAEDAKVPESAPQIEMEDIHVVEAMDQDALSGPITAHGIDRRVNLCSHSSRHQHRICPIHQAENKHRGRLGHDAVGTRSQLEHDQQCVLFR